MSNRKTAAKQGKGCRKGALVALVAGALALQGCISLGEDPPDSLFTRTARETAPDGTLGEGDMTSALAVLDPEAPRRLDVTRVPVQVDDSSIAYLADAMWVEKPARLFGRLLAETIRARGSRLVIEDSSMRNAAGTRLSGQLVDMGYDASLRAVVVRYDAILRLEDGAIRTRRFEVEIDDVDAIASEVGPALNNAANDVAAEVADWVG